MQTWLLQHDVRQVSEPGTANEKKIWKFLGGPEACTPPPPPPPWKILKVKTKICAIWGILEVNLKKCSTLKFRTIISLLPSICIHRIIVLIFIEKNMLVDFFFPQKKYFSPIFDFRFRDKFQALSVAQTWTFYTQTPLTFKFGIDMSLLCVHPFWTATQTLIATDLD